MKPRPVELNQRFGRGVVIDPDVGRTRWGGVLVRLRCDCGTAYQCVRTSLFQGDTKSCGCLNSELSAERMWKGEDVGYHGRHLRLTKATNCIFGCEHTHYENAHNLGETGPPDEYMSLCKTCHSRFDSAIRMMQQDPMHDYRGRWEPARTAQEWTKYKERDLLAGDLEA